MARSGSFTSLGGIGALTLDPFGGSRGGFGRYLLGDSMASIDAAERYAIAVGWQNGTISDADYLASLQKAIDLSPEGSHDRIAAQDAYDDAKYTIGRNKLVRNINNAATDDARISGYRNLIDYDKAKLAGMVQDNEQRRELVDRIAGAQADIRATRWGQLVRQYNENKVSNDAMVRFARAAATEAVGQPDQQTWTDRVFEFSERIKDDHLEQLRQDYDMNRVDGSVVLAFVTQRLKEMAPGSPRYNDLTRWREDFAKAWHADEAASTYAQKYSAYQEGRISDDEWLHYLHSRVSDAPAGSDERKAAQHDLVMESFRVTENHLIYNVAVNNAPVGQLINFYKTSLVGMDHSSARAQDLLQKIHDLKTQGISAIDLGGSAADPDHTAPGHYVGGNPGPNGGARSSNNPSVEAVIQSARSYLGTTYRLGGESRSAIDCSGLVYRAFTDAGYGALIGGDRRKAEGYQAYGEANGEFFTDRHDAQRGDLVIYGNGKHIGIYLGGGRVLSAVTTGVTIHRANALGIQITGYVHPSYSGSQPPSSAQRPGHTVHRPTPNQPNQHPGGGGPGGVAPQRRRLAQETPQSVRPGEPTTTRVVPSAQTTGTTPATDLPPTGQQQRPALELPGATLQMGRELLKRLGVNNPSDAQVRAAGAWLWAENGQTVSNNNPFNLITGVGTGTGNWLPGQVDVDGSGYAVFGTWQQGIAAAANEIQNAYPTIASAFRSGNPNAILTTIEKSEWRPGGYNNQLTSVYNNSGPSEIVIAGGQRIFENTPPSLAVLANQVPSVSHLFDINYGDPQQQAWFDRNMTALKTAYSSRTSNGTWQFETLAGNIVTLPFDAQMYFDGLQAKAEYQKISGDPVAEAATREDLRKAASGYTLESYNAELDAIDAAASQAYADGNISLALSLKAQALSASAKLLNVDAATTDLSTQNYRPAPGAYDTLDDDQLTRVQERLDKINPLTSTNPNGDPLLGLFDVQSEAPSGQAPLWLDNNGQLHVHEEDVYFAEDGDGNIKIVTWRDRPPDFAADDVIDPATGQTKTVPHYKTTTIALGVGAQVQIRVPKGTEGTLGVSILDRAGYKDPRVSVPTLSAPAQSYLGISGNANVGTVGAPPKMFDITGDTPLVQNGLIADRSNPRYGLPANGTTPANQAPPAVEPTDYLVRRALSHVNVPMVRYKDHATDQWMQAYSIDGGNSWIIAPQKLDIALPNIVLDPDLLNKQGNKQARINPQTQMLEVMNAEGKWNNYNAQTDGPLAQWFHWYGTDQRDNAGLSQGAQGSNYVIHRADANGGFDGSINRREALTLTDSDAYRRAAATYAAGAKGRQQVETQHPWLANEIRGVEGGFNDPYANAPPAPPTTPLSQGALNTQMNQLAGGYAAATTLPKLSGSITAAISRALALMATARASTTPSVAPTSTVTPTTPVRPPLAADQPKTTPVQQPAAPKPLETPVAKPVPKPVPPAPKSSYNTYRTPPVNPRPQPAPAPGPKPTLPGVSNRPRAPHEYD